MDLMGSPAQIQYAAKRHAHVEEAVAMTRSPDHGADWVIVDLHGRYPTYGPRGLARTALQREVPFETLAARLDRIARTAWVRGVLVRTGGLATGLATTDAVGRLLGRLAERTRVVAYLPRVSMRTLLATARLAEVVAPESAEVSVPGFAVEQVFLGSLLARHGIGVETLRIAEYKTALARFSDERMDAYDREQLTAYLGSAERSWLAALSRARGMDGAQARTWFDRGFTSAGQLLEAGLVTRVAYDDDIVVPVERPLARAVELVGPRLPTGRPGRRADGVTVVPVVGTIVSGRSRGTPPVPLVPGPFAGADTVVAALRRAQRDRRTRAVVLYVDSRGGSAVASDLICRAVARLGKPVVAVMGEVAASGGYYVLAQADHVVASPYTVTGSIGVLVGKPVLTEFNARHGLNPEAVGREGALFGSPSRPFSDADRAWAQQMMREVYDRFVDRVATGRRLSAERVDEIGRGRIWSGADALEVGLVDELGDLEAGVAAARRLAGLPDDAPTRTVSARLTVPGAPTFGRQPASALEVLWPFGSERVLTWSDRVVSVR